MPLQRGTGDAKATFALAKKRAESGPRCCTQTCRNAEIRRCEREQMLEALHRGVWAAAGKKIVFKHVFATKFSVGELQLLLL